METPHLDKLKKQNLDKAILSQNSNNHTRRKYIRSLLTKDLLLELASLEMSIYSIEHEILKPICLYPTPIRKLWEEYGIPHIDMKKACSFKKTRDKFVSTCRNRYGSDNVLSKGTSVFHKRNEVVKERYGCENVFQSELIKKKSKETMVERYGVEHATSLPWYRSNNGRKSKPHLFVENILKNLNIEFVSEVPDLFKKYNEGLGKIYNPIVDILIPNKKIVIEINGDLYHANPQKYSENDLIRLWRGTVPAKDIWEREKSRKEQIESFGYKVHVIWASEVKRGGSNLIEKIKNIYENSEIS